MQKPLLLTLFIDYVIYRYNNDLTIKVRIVLKTVLLASSFINKIFMRIATFLSPNLLPFYRKVAVQLAQKLETDLDFVVGNDYEQFKQESFDFVFACGFWYAHNAAEYSPLVAPVMTADRYEAAPVYFVDLAIRADEEGDQLENWRGKKFGFNENHSFSGYHALQHYFIETNSSIADFFGQQIQTKSHLNSIKALRNSDIDIAAIDSTVLDLEYKKEPTLSQKIKVLVSLGPYPVPPLLINQKIEQEYRQRALEAMVSLPSATFKSYQMQKFCEVNPVTYSALIKLANSK